MECRAPERFAEAFTVRKAQARLAQRRRLRASRIPGRDGNRGRTGSCARGDVGSSGSGRLWRASAPAACRAPADDAATSSLTARAGHSADRGERARGNPLCLRAGHLPPADDLSQGPAEIRRPGRRRPQRRHGTDGLDQRHRGSGRPTVFRRRWTSMATARTTGSCATGARICSSTAGSTSARPSLHGLGSGAVVLRERPRLARRRPDRPIGRVERHAGGLRRRRQGRRARASDRREVRVRCPARRDQP